MNFPLDLIPTMAPWQIARYHEHVNSDESGWHRKWTESIWRRHQHPSNARLSGWKSEADGRRRLIHFYDEYGARSHTFVLENTWLAIHLTLPSADLDAYRDRVIDLARSGQWGRHSRGRREEFTRGDLTATLECWDTHPEDAKRGYRYPRGYRHMEIRVRTNGYEAPADLPLRPFRWFHEVGLREMISAGNPRYVRPEELAAHFPAQIELGCGPSTEAGIPHLSSLHRIYGVSNADYSFVFTAPEDNALEVFADTERKYRQMAEIYRACMMARPTSFFHAIRDLWAAGHLVGPVITNNFDCLCADLGLPEHSLRRYDRDPYFPMYRGNGQIAFDPRARSLLVVGVHADRRMAQKHARQQGIPVMYIDPEQYRAPDGTLIYYPVEAPQDGDLFVRSSAGEAIGPLYGALTGRQLPQASEPAAARA